MLRRTIRRFFVLAAASLLAATTAQAQNPGSSQGTQAPGSAPAQGAQPPDPNQISPGVTVTGKPLHDQDLPNLPPDEFSKCVETHGMDLQFNNPTAISDLSECEHQMDFEKRIVIDACINRDGKAAPPRVIQACTELLEHNIIHGYARSYIFVNRAQVYFGQGDKQRALDDYNEAVKLSPHNADLYYNRGVFYAAQADTDAALRDFDAAIGINAKHVPALRQRAKIYLARGNFGGALADYSEAIRLEPKAAALWSERGYVSLRQHDYANAVTDESHAIQVDPKLARAYFWRGVAFGGLDDRQSAVDDLKTAVSLDPSLDRFVVSSGKVAQITLPPL